MFTNYLIVSNGQSEITTMKLSLESVLEKFFLNSIGHSFLVRHANNIAVNSSRLPKFKKNSSFGWWSVQRSQDKQESAYFFYKFPQTRIILFVVECLEHITVV